jgi:RNA polymerase sigma-70 factor (ECF subfamily)
VPDSAPPSAAEDRVPTWEEVARDHGSFLYTVAFRLTGDHDEAQDLVQDVLLRVQRGLATYEPGSIKGWLSRITTNAFLDGVRKRKRRPTDPLPDHAEEVIPGAPAADDALDRAGLPAHIQEAVRGLPYDYRAAVVLSDVVGLPYQEIADSIGVPVGTVRSRIHRGRAQLRVALEGER